MRKFTKIITVFLAVALLFGILTVSSFAEESHRLVPENTDSGFYEDYENHDIGKIADDERSIILKSGFATKTPENMTFSIDSQSNKTHTNKYFNLKYKGVNPTQTYVDFKPMNAQKKATINSDNYEYVFFEFDFCSMQKTYNNTSYFQFNTTSTGVNSAGLLNMFFFKSGNDWYLADAKNNPTRKVMLSNTVGEWNHITIVMHFNHEAEHNSTIAYYCNGELVAEKTFNMRKTTVSTDSLRLWLNQSNSILQDTDFAFDNFSSYGFQKGYVSEGIYGIDDYFADENYREKSLFDVADVLYNENYYYVGTQNLSVATIEHADGTTSIAQTLSKALKSFDDGSYVVLGQSITDYTPDVGLETITFVCYDGVSISLSKEAREKYKEYRIGNTYTFKLKDAGDGIKLRWLKSADGQEVFEEQMLLPYASPNITKFDEVEFWTWDIDGAGTRYQSVKLNGNESFTLKEINILKELYNIKSIDLIPTYKNTAASVLSTQSGLKADNCDYNDDGNVDINNSESDVIQGNVSNVIVKNETLYQSDAITRISFKPIYSMLTFMYCKY